MPKRSMDWTETFAWRVDALCLYWFAPEGSAVSVDACRRDFRQMLLARAPVGHAPSKQTIHRWFGQTATHERAPGGEEMANFLVKSVHEDWHRRDTVGDPAVLMSAVRALVDGDARPLREFKEASPLIVDRLKVPSVERLRLRLAELVLAQAHPDFKVEKEDRDQKRARQLGAASGGPVELYFTKWSAGVWAVGAVEPVIFHGHPARAYRRFKPFTAIAACGLPLGYDGSTQVLRLERGTLTHEGSKCVLIRKDGEPLDSTDKYDKVLPRSGWPSQSGYMNVDDSEGSP